MSKTKRYLSVTELSNLLGIHRDTIIKQLKRGVITHASRVGNKWIIDIYSEYPELFQEARNG